VSREALETAVRQTASAAHASGAGTTVRAAPFQFDLLPARTVRCPLLSYEQELIEAALAENSGKVAGPTGAAVKLGIPRSMPDLKIKQLNLKKHNMP